MALSRIEPEAMQQERAMLAQQRWTSRKRRLVLGLILVDVVVAVLLATLVLIVLHDSRMAYAAQARYTAQYLGTVVQESVAAEFSRVDAVMRSTLNELDLMHANGTLTEAAIKFVLDTNQKLLPGTEALRLSDASGQVRWGTALPEGPAFRSGIVTIFSGAVTT